MLLRKVSKDRLETLVKDQTFLTQLTEVKRERTQYYSQEGWFLCDIRIVNWVPWLISAWNMDSVKRCRSMPAI